MPEPVKIEVKSVKHTFTPEERNELGSNLARSIGAERGIESEFDQVKSAFKARLTEAEARIDNISTSLVNGFEMRNERCRVVYFPEERKKHFFLEKDADGVPASLIEDMTKEDFQAELILAESKFDNREDLALFAPTESDSGWLVVGKFAGKWFTALRIKIGKMELTERLDSEQKAYKKRSDAVYNSVTRAQTWLNENLREHAKGFQDSLASLVEAQKERTE